MYGNKAKSHSHQYKVTSWLIQLYHLLKGLKLETLPRLKIFEKYVIFKKKFVTCNSILMIHFYNSYKISLVNDNETDKKKEKVLESFQYLQSLEKLFNGSMVS